MSKEETIMRSRVFRLFIVVFAVFSLNTGCLKSLPGQEGAGKRITKATFMDVPEDVDETLQMSTGIIENLAFAAHKGIIEILFTNGVGVALIPDLSKDGFIAAGNRGTGVFLVRHKNQWSMPVFVSILSDSLVEQFGAASTSFLLIFRNPETVAQLKKAGNISLDAGLTATPGPTGVLADLSFVRDADIVGYGFTEGNFFGIYISEGVLSLVPELTLVYYENPGKGVVRGYYADEAQTLIHDLLSPDDRSIPEGASKRSARRLKLAFDRLISSAGR